MPGLACRDCTLEDRGTFDGFRRAQFARRRTDPRVAEHQHIAARISQRNLLGSAPTRRLAGEAWPGAAHAPRTPTGQRLSTFMRDWVAAATNGTGR